MFQFRLQSKMVGGPAGDVIQTIRMFNYQTHTHEVVDVRSTSSTDTTVLVTPGGDTSRFIQPGTKELTTGIQWASPTFSGPPFTWHVEINETVWLIAD